MIENYNSALNAKRKLSWESSILANQANKFTVKSSCLKTYITGVQIWHVTEQFLKLYFKTDSTSKWINWNCSIWKNKMTAIYWITDNQEIFLMVGLKIRSQKSNFN